MNKKAPSESDLCNIIWRPYWISVVSRAEYTWLKHQMKVNFILNRIVIENLCNWMNSFEVIWKELYCGRHLGILAAILEWPKLHAMHYMPKLWEFMSQQKSSCEVTWLQQRFWSYYEKVLFGSHLGKWRSSKLCRTWRTPIIDILI